MKKKFLIGLLVLAVAALAAVPLVTDVEATRSSYKSRLLLPSAYGFSPVPQAVQTFTASGTYFWPPGITRAVVVCCGQGPCYWSLSVALVTPSSP